MWNTIAYSKHNALGDADGYTVSYTISYTKCDAKCNSDGNAIGDTYSYAESFGYAKRDADAFSYSQCNASWVCLWTRLLEESS